MRQPAAYRRHEPEHETAVLPARDVRRSEACPTAASSGGTWSGCGSRSARPAASVLVTSSNYRTTLAGLHVVRAASRLSYRGEDRGPPYGYSPCSQRLSRVQRMSGIREQPWLPGQLRSAISRPQRPQAGCSRGVQRLARATDRWPLPARKLVDDYAQFAQTCQRDRRCVRPQIPGLSPGGLGPHLTSSGFPLRAFLRFPVCPPGPSPSSAFSWFPFVRRSPVCSLRPLPGFRFPFGFPPGSLPLSNLHVSAAVRRFRRRWSRAAGTKVTSPAATISPRSRDPPALQMGSGWARWDVATEPPVTSGRERRASPRREPPR